MNTSEIITPWLTENLESLHKHEEEIRTKSILEINANPKLKEQLVIIQESLNMIFDLIKSYRSQTDDELTIQDWKTSSNKDRLQKYSPAVIRKALDRRDGFKGKQREQMYKLLCEYAAHPTYPGFKMVAPKGLGEIGPFLDAKYLKATFEELSLRVPLFSIIYLSHFENLPPEFLKIRIEYLVNIKNWSQKYLKIDLFHIDVESLRKQVNELMAVMNLRE